MGSVQFASSVWQFLIFRQWLLYDLDDAFYTDIAVQMQLLQL